MRLHDQQLYFSPNARYFLLPAGHALPPGELALRALDGSDELRVDAAAAAAFEVGDAAAKAHLQAVLDQAFKQASTAFAGLVSIADSQARQTATGTARPKQADIDAIAKLVRAKPSELRRKPELIRAGVRSLVEQLQAALDESTTDPAAQTAVRERLHALRSSLQGYGLDPGDAFERLPEHLQLFARLTEEQATSADSEAVGRRIDEVVASLEQRFDGLIGESKAQRAERKQREYRQSARSAIAESLRAHGITPLDTGDTTGDTSK